MTLIDVVLVHLGEDREAWVGVCVSFLLTSVEIRRISDRSRERAWERAAMLTSGHGVSLEMLAHVASSAPLAYRMRVQEDAPAPAERARWGGGSDPCRWPWVAWVFRALTRLLGASHGLEDRLVLARIFWALRGAMEGRAREDLSCLRPDGRRCAAACVRQGGGCGDARDVDGLVRLDADRRWGEGL